jgi:hypothetical protein
VTQRATGTGNDVLLLCYCCPAVVAAAHGVWRFGAPACSPTRLVEVFKTLEVIIRLFGAVQAHSAAVCALRQPWAGVPWL